MEKSQTELVGPPQFKATEVDSDLTRVGTLLPGVMERRFETVETRQPAEEPDVPTFTLHASNPFQLRAFIQIAQSAEGLGCPREELREISRVLREFELYEERNRR